MKERTRERAPADWAVTQNNLGGALESLGNRTGDTGLLQEAIAAHREASKERTRERAPADWALTQNNIGSALVDLGYREKSITRLKEAAAAFRAAMEVGEKVSGPERFETWKQNLSRTESLLAKLNKQPQ